MRVLLILLLIVSCANCAKILGVFPAISPSHYILGSTLMRALAERGHDVTVISTVGEKELPKNGTYRDIVVSGFAEFMKAKMAPQSSDGSNNSSTGSMFDKESMNPFAASLFIAYKIPQLMEKVLQDEKVQELIHSDEKFDVVIVQQFLNDAHKVLAAHFDAPLIVFNLVGTNFWVDGLVGNPSPPSYISNIIAAYPVPMSFFTRLSNTLVNLFNMLLYHCYVYPQQEEMVKKYIPNAPDFYDVIYNASIVLINGHPSLNQAVPYVPNMIDIGGFHIKPPKTLPQDLQEYLDNAKEGVLYFSMGSNLKSAQLPPEKRDIILKAFLKLKQKVLWKWEEDNLPGQPPNVRTAKWLPQQDLLAHPNIKIFITHGGFGSTLETIYHGVPILAIPILGDQKLNAKIAVASGYGLIVPYGELSEETLLTNLNEILTNPTYKDNAKKKSELFHDRMVSPMDTAMYWVEYVIRHRGAPHLRVAGVDLPWYKYLLFDVIAFLVTVVTFSTFVFCYCIKLVCKKGSKKVKKA